jgi:hypothetical protein
MLYSENFIEFGVPVDVGVVGAGDYQLCIELLTPSIVDACGGPMQMSLDFELVDCPDCE